MRSLESWCREIYYGTTPEAVKVRYGLLTIDLLIISYFVVTTFLPPASWLVGADIVIGCLLIVDLTGRLIADTDRIGLLSKPLTVLDIAVILSMFLPATFGNAAFLRVVRAMRIMRSYQFTRQLRHHSKFFAHNEDVIFSGINLLVFIFVVTAAVFVLQHDSNAEINNYIDALYFTIATLTTQK